jgi:hypothetical protein
MRIKFEAFSKCGCLTTICIPSSVQYIEDNCFIDCSSLTNFTLSPPCQIIELRSFPARLVRPFEVPDSVEVCDTEDLISGRGCHLLTFGRASRLREFGRESLGAQYCSPVFLQVSSGALKRMRSALEWGPVGAPDFERSFSDGPASDDGDWSDHDFC